MLWLSIWFDFVECFVLFFGAMWKSLFNVLCCSWCVWDLWCLHFYSLNVKMFDYKMCMIFMCVMKFHYTKGWIYRYKLSFIFITKCIVMFTKMYWCNGNRWNVNVCCMILPLQNAIWWMYYFIVKVVAIRFKIWLIILSLAVFKAI